MTNYADMPAGPEMDRLVAEKAMGLFPKQDKTGGWYMPREGPKQYNWDSAEFCAEIFYEKGPYQGNFQPSVNIAHAWEVVVKLRQYFTRVEVHSVMSSYVCLIEKDSGEVTESYVASAEADTAPLAICRASLIAMESK